VSLVWISREWVVHIPFVFVYQCCISFHLRSRGNLRRRTWKHATRDDWRFTRLSTGICVPVLSIWPKTTGKIMFVLVQNCCRKGIYLHACEWSRSTAKFAWDTWQRKNRCNWNETESRKATQSCIFVSTKLLILGLLIIVGSHPLFRLIQIWLEEKK